MADALTIVEQDRTRQSRTAPRLNRAVRGLKALWIPGINPAHGGGPVGSPVGIGTVLVNGRLAGNFDGSTSRIEVPRNLVDNGRHTILVGAVQVTVAGLHYMMGADYNDGGDNIEHWSLRNNAGSIDLAYYNGTGYSASVTSPALGSYNVYFGLLGAGGVTDSWQVGYIDRAGVETLSSATSVPAASRAGKRVWIGCGANAGSPWRFWNTQIAFVAIFAGWLTVRERRQYAANPWLLQEPDEEPVFYSLPAGGDQTISLSDSGTGVDGLSLSVALSLSEVAAAVEQLGIGVAFGVGDGGTGADGFGGGLGAQVPLADTGSGADALSAAVQFVVTDAGSGAELVSLITDIVKSLTDAGVGTDSLGISVTAAVDDAGTAAEGVVINVSLPVLADAGAGTDSISVLQSVLIAVADAAQALDSVGAVSVQLTLAESGTGIDVPGIQALLQVLEQASGMDVVLVSNPSAPRIARILFTPRARRVQFTQRGRAVQFSLRQRAIKFTLH